MSEHRLKWLGHSGWQISTASGTRILIDPWLSGNPLSPVRIDDVDAADFILLTHDHGDHAGDAVALAKRTGATLVGQPETMNRYKNEGAEKTMNMNIGGAVDLGGTRVTMTEAFHTSATGTAAGYILEFADGKTVYHTGDTGLNANMASWGELFSIDLVLLPIGGHYTMDARQAAHALKLLKAKTAVPMHFRTFPVLAQSAEEFVELAGKTAPGTQVRVIEPGEEIAL